MSHSRNDLFDNFLDREVQKMFFPLNITQWLFLLPKYRIYKNFITFNNSKTEALSSTIVIVSLIFLCFRLYMFIGFYLLKEYWFFVFVLIYDFIFYWFGFVLTFISNIIFRKFNVELVLNIQRTFRLIKFNHYKQFEMFNIFSWFCMIIIISYNIIYIFISNLLNTLAHYDHILWILTSHFDMNIIYASRINAIINHQLKLWICEFTKAARSSCMEKVGSEFNFERRIRILGNRVIDNKRQ